MNLRNLLNLPKNAICIFYYATINNLSLVGYVNKTTVLIHSFLRSFTPNFNEEMCRITYLQKYRKKYSWPHLKKSFFCGFLFSQASNMKM